MPRLITVILLLLFLCGIFSCSSTKNIADTYHSNFAVAGFFVTKLTLNLDSTFGYRMRGDVMFDTANGKYKVDHRYLILLYNPLITDTAISFKSGQNDVIQIQPLTNSLSRPEQFYIGHHKLFVADTLGNIQKKEQGISRHKKYLFWGQHYYVNKRRYYLERVD